MTGQVTPMGDTPPVPPCPSWCDREHECGPDSWDLESSIRNGVEVAKWCSKLLRLPTKFAGYPLDVIANVAVSWETGDGDPEWDNVEITIEPHQLTKHQAEALAHALLALLAVTS